MSEKLVPLESNPEVMNKFLQKLGVPSEWEIVDVMGLDSETLLWVPRPVLAVILLFPTSEKFRLFMDKQELLVSDQKVSKDLFYMKQYVGNTCGTVALIHSVANNTDKINLSDGVLKKFLEEAKPLTPPARGELMKTNEGILNAHKELAQEGQTNTPTADEEVIHHFIAFVHKDGELYGLDGSIADIPIKHGPSSPDTLLEDAAEVCKKYMALDPTEVRFTVLALAASDY